MASTAAAPLPIDAQLIACRDRIAPICSGVPAHRPAFTLIFSISDGQRRARVLHSCSNSFDRAWNDGARQVREHARRNDMKSAWLRIDWIEGVAPITWAQLEAQIAGIKRNYFRLGLALDLHMRRVLTEQEINANAMLYAGPQQASAAFNKNNFELYLRQRFPHEPAADFTADRIIYLLTTSAVFCGDDGEVHRLTGTGLDAGRRQCPALTAQSVLPLVANGSRYLAQQVQDNGQFIYGRFPCFDRRIPGYNTLRHASSLYAMLEAWELTRDGAVLAAIDRGIDFLCKQLLRRYRMPDGSTAAFLIDVGNEIKLGGNAVCLLALVKHSELTGSREHWTLLEELAQGIGSMQGPGNGRFNHVLNAGDLSLKQASRIIYYDGEAAFGLMRLYALTRDSRWLAMVERAFDHFIASQHWQAHDHWLSYCVNELTRWRPLEKYFRFGIQNVAGYLDFVLDRKTTFPTLLELMVAAQRMLERLDGIPALRHLLQEIDQDKFEQALHFRANYLLNGHFWPEMAMYFRKPKDIVGSFFIRHHSFRVRIDDVEHYLSGLVGYHHLLNAREAASATGHAVPPPDGPWSAQELADATGGAWITPPPPDWMAHGVAPRTLPGHARVLSIADHRRDALGRPRSATRAIRMSGVHCLLHPPAAILCSDPLPQEGIGVPVLHVSRVKDALSSLARHARQRFSGRVVGVAGTGNGGETTALLAQALSAWGPVGRPPGGTSTPRGLGWNLTCLPSGASAWVVELGLTASAAMLTLLRPDVLVLRGAFSGADSVDAVNVSTISRSLVASLPAHSRMVLDADGDIPAAETLAALHARGIPAVTYGEGASADVRLLKVDQGELEVLVGGEPLRLYLPAAGRNVAISACATLAALLALDLAPGAAAQALSEYVQSGNRSAFHTVPLAEGSFHLIDQSYDANPASMRAALTLLGQVPCPPTQRVAMLGDMQDTGPAAQASHLALAGPLLAARPNRVLLCGPLMSALHERISHQVQSNWFADVGTMSNALVTLIRPGDWVLAKAARHIGMGRLTRALKSLS